MSETIKNVAKKSVGKDKKTSIKKVMKQINPIITLMSVLISKKYANYGRCPDNITEEYDGKIMNYLKNLGYTDDNITEMLNLNKELVNDCKKAYKEQKGKTNGRMWRDYVLNPMVDVDACFGIIIPSMTEDFIDAAVSKEALGDVLGVLVNKKSQEVWDYVAGIQKQAKNNAR